VVRKLVRTERGASTALRIRLEIPYSTSSGQLLGCSKSSRRCRMVCVH